MGALPDPVLSINALNLPANTFDVDQEPMAQMQIGVSQSIPFPGKRKLKRTVAEYEMLITGTGADVMQRIAAPMVGGMLTTTFLTLLVLPVIYCMVTQVSERASSRA